MSKISIIGAGAWGTAFAIHMVRRKFDVDLWVRETDLARRMEQNRINDIFLPDFPLPENVSPTSDISRALGDAEFVFWAVPTQFLSQVIGTVENHTEIPSISLAKGIERGTWRFPYRILSDSIGTGCIAVLSGPSFAIEVAAGQPTVMTVAAESHELATQIQKFVSDDKIRIYRSDDPLGVSLGGAYKNIIAIATGISEGLRLGQNARAALITRGLSEMVRLGEAIGAQRESLFGAAGVGDMILTCTSHISRNYGLGLRIGAGEKFGDIIASMNHVAEGAFSTFGALHIAKEYKIELPIATEVHHVLWKGKSPYDGLRALMSRPLKKEW